MTAGWSIVIRVACTAHVLVSLENWESVIDWNVQKAFGFDGSTTVAL